MAEGFPAYLRFREGNGGMYIETGKGHHQKRHSQQHGRSFQTTGLSTEAVVQLSEKQEET
jgi:hypothetical protein